MTSEDRKELDALVLADRRCAFCGTREGIEPLADASGWTCAPCCEKAARNGQAAIDFLKSWGRR